MNTPPIPVAGAGRTIHSDILGGFTVMRWLMIGLLVSLGALLFAAAGMAWRICLERAKFRREALGRIGPPHENDREL
jgi:hypothetical protein